jgi:hypothetical protein
VNHFLVLDALDELDTLVRVGAKLASVLRMKLGMKDRFAFKSFQIWSGRSV